MLFLAALGVSIIQSSLISAQSSAGPDDIIMMSPNDIVANPTTGLGGAKVSKINLFGDSEKDGMYVVRNTFSDGELSPPHYHDKDRFITVISGTWYLGANSIGGCEGTTALPAGSFSYHPAGVLHYDGACDGEVTIEVTGVGPVITTRAK